jgi:hypothetical protein
MHARVRAMVIQACLSLLIFSYHRFLFWKKGFSPIEESRHGFSFRVRFLFFSFHGWKWYGWMDGYLWCFLCLGLEKRGKGMGFGRMNMNMVHLSIVDEIDMEK